MMRSNLLSNLWTMLCTPRIRMVGPSDTGDFAPVRSPEASPGRPPSPDRTNEDEQDENEEKEGGGVWVT